MQYLTSKPFKGPLIDYSRDSIWIEMFFIIGEIMQLFIDDDPTKRFNDYIDKTYRKTASLMANSCKAVSTIGFILSNSCLCSHQMYTLAYKYKTKYTKYI